MLAESNVKLIFESEEEEDNFDAETRKFANLVSKIVVRTHGNNFYSKLRRGKDL